jgi:general secretion pathway protein M
MILLDRAILRRVAALAVLAALVAAVWIGPFAAYCGWVGANEEALAAKSAMLGRYQALATPASGGVSPAEPALLYREMPESQASALLQEAVKNAATAARVQVQGLQMLRSEALPGATRIGVRVRATGDIASLRGLIYAIETARPVLYPDNLQVQAHATTPDAAPALLDFQLDISGFTPEPAS